MDEDQAEYFVILAQDSLRAQSICHLSRMQRFMVETSYQDDPTIGRKFVVIAGQEIHVLQEAKRYWDLGVLLVCVQCIKTYNSKHLLRALKKVYGLSGNSKSSTMNFSGQEMILHEGTKFNQVKYAAKVLGENLNHGNRTFLEEQNERLGKTIEELRSNNREGEKRGSISKILSGLFRRIIEELRPNNREEEEEKRGTVSKTLSGFLSFLIVVTSGFFWWVAFCIISFIFNSLIQIFK